ncbi:sigma-70 family RNA polymerase sigma factor [Sphingobacterium sp. DK4209]|uniref:Sigma-70 family RNA polymerase sigma factor n=1 Tax=Sphingobacterium zhuxiongii TaxID=2662364 RepID=A0A5Q0QHL2_9SPHI|nr:MULTISPECIES: RNA polymerase sigma factor [unclassified Sphingobacterium]MVZ67332.1 sigma-70 family RNA polymerase sigma factor [Sphingobacterium sp. DK4209]QGA26920.1 sigma-70 family RNA polymerase sigma factor [Sphingobacterium sp. dk4302]
MKTNLNTTILESSPVLMRLANNFTNDPVEKDDLVQETFIRSLNSLEKFTKHPKLISWLYVIMKNIYLNKYRREIVRRSAEKEISYTQSFNSRIGNKAESLFVLKDVQDALKLLSGENYQIISMYLEGFKYYEIAEHMNMKEGTIKTRIHSIRKFLKKKLQVYAL